MDITAARGQFVQLAAQVNSDPGDVLWEPLLVAARPGRCRSELQALLHDARAVIDLRAAERLLQLCETAAELGSGSVARRALLREPIALRWEAARVLGRTRALIAS